MDFKAILAQAETALNVIVTAGNIPGVQLIPYVGTIMKYIAYGKAAIEAGKAIEPAVTDFMDSFANGLPSEEKRAAQDARITANHEKIQGFVPVAEEGEDE